jgi:hypothetical protein
MPEATPSFVLLGDDLEDIQPEENRHMDTQVSPSHLPSVCHQNPLSTLYVSWMAGPCRGRHAGGDICPAAPRDPHGDCESTSLQDPSGSICTALCVRHSCLVPRGELRQWCEGQCAGAPSARGSSARILHMSPVPAISLNVPKTQVERSFLNCQDALGPIKHLSRFLAPGIFTQSPACLTNVCSWIFPWTYAMDT